VGTQAGTLRVPQLTPRRARQAAFLCCAWEREANWALNLAVATLSSATRSIHTAFPAHNEKSGYE